MEHKKTSIKKFADVPLAIVARGDEVCMLVRVDKKAASSLHLLVSFDGIDFVQAEQEIVIKDLKGKNEKIALCEKFSLSSTPNGFVMTYVRKSTLVKKSILVVARSKDLYEWKAMSEIPADESLRTTIVYNKPKDMFELYRDGLFIKHQSSMTMTIWKDKPTLLFTSRAGQFDQEKLSIIGSTVTEEGILLIYDASVVQKTDTLLQAGAVILDKNNPKHVIWRSMVPMWQGIFETDEKGIPVTPLGMVAHKKNFLIYWLSADFEIIVAKVPAFLKETEENKYHPRILKRFHGNPILAPQLHHYWENEGAFNPTVIEDKEGIIHLVYRAVGSDGLSRVGYAQSKDGLHFDKRSPYPIYEPSRGYGMPEPGKQMGPEAYNPYIYTSGGGWGGAEDPRTVLIDETVYMVYTAFEGWNSMRIALTSISIDDFKAGKWRWRKPRLISSPENRSKNWLLFPEKVNGKFAVLHSISPKILVDYVDDIDTFDDIIFSPRPEGPQPGRKNSWDHFLKGAGPPPVKTELGWLLMYHALEKTDTGKYRLGAMILDFNDPTKVLYRAAHPILSPDMHYENDGKPGVVYASGALIRGDDLFVYYGGGDKVVCVATTPLKEFLNYLKTGSTKDYELKLVK